ncbi:hypothetical protein IFM89_028583 [Coptis chinensis]|uniref:Rx N-terminal domain-containing protein n=1 Tax=Coptis chinensis TaxID=261450 RepID=A0A835M4I1_9MAGN|nr:hypothetical protein IFM89_028583 [Coptis chinensis]
MAHAVISGVLEQLRFILQTEVNLLVGVRKEGEKLTDTLSLILGVLEDAEEKQIKSGIVKGWLEQLTRISYVADDVLDEWKTEILSSQIQLLDVDYAPLSEKVWSCLFSLFSCLKSDNVHNDFGSKMIDINERLGTVRDITLLNLTERQSREEPRPVTSSIVDDSEIYGRVDDIYCIMLKLNECYSLRKLPEGIWKLPNLRHLELKETFALNYFPRGLERLRCLRTLSRVKFNGGKGCQIGELKLLDHIQGELRIEGLGQVADPIEAVLQKKEKLRSLDLRFSEERHDDARREESVLNGLQPHTNLAKLYILFYQGNKFPSWMSNNIALPNLVKLELRDCTQCSELPALGRLQNLEHLELWKLGSVKRIGSRVLWTGKY